MVVAVPSVAELANVPLFSALDLEELAQLANWLHRQNAGEGVRLVGEGAPGYTFFILTDGTAGVMSEGKNLATLGPGDFFGEIAILGEGRRTATVTSTSPVRLLVMFGTEFRQLEATHPEIASRIREAMQVRLATRSSEPAPGLTPT
jgi:voltage-gated potassium channel